MSTHAPAAVLFDMDGLLVDTEPVWTVAEQEMARELGGTWDAAIKAEIVGTRLEVAVPTVLRHYGAPTDAATVQRWMSWLLDRMVALFAQDLAPMPGARELLSALRAAGVPVALVSSSYRVLVDAVLAGGVGPFDVTVAGDEVERGKPDPQPYLLAARLLGVDPARCVVLEDSPSGVASGTAAGCAVVAVPSVAGVAVEPGPRRLVLPTLSGLEVAALAELAGR